MSQFCRPNFTQPLPREPPDDLHLHMQEARIYLDVIREFYEAFVIYNFFMYLLLYLEDTYGNVDAFYSTKDDVEHIWGFQYILTPWRMGHEFFWQCKTGVLSYVILRPLMTLTGTRRI